MSVFSLDLSLEIRKASTVRDALKSFTKAEVLDGANKYRCSSCGCKTRAVKRFSLHRVPHVLQLHLKRFETQWGGHSKKISRHVSFAMSMSVAEFVSESERGAMGSSTYSLYGVVVHSGHSVRSGHYYAFVRGSNGVWYEMDDDQVRTVPQSTVLKQQAYMLFYIQQPAGPDSPALRPKPGSSPLLQAQVSSGGLLSKSHNPSSGPMPVLSLASATAGQTSKSAKTKTPGSLAALLPRNSNRDSEEEEEDEDDDDDDDHELRTRCVERRP